MFEWTAAATDAAQLVADGELSFNAIAQAVGTSHVTLRKWRREDEFAGRVAELRGEYRELVRRRGIADREKRIDALADRHRRMCQVMAERAADPRMASIPGGRTGLVVITDWKEILLPIGDGSKATDRDGDESASRATIPTMVPIHEVDTGLLKELRAHEQQAAQEVGQ